MKKNITCPEKGCLAVLEYTESAETSRIVGATRCSLIEGEVDCDQLCVHRLNEARDRRSAELLERLAD